MYQLSITFYFLYYFVILIYLCTKPRVVFFHPLTILDIKVRNCAVISKFSHSVVIDLLPKLPSISYNSD